MTDCIHTHFNSPAQDLIKIILSQQTRATIKAQLDIHCQNNSCWQYSPSATVKMMQQKY